MNSELQPSTNCRILIIGKGSFIGSNYIKYSRYKDITEVDSLHTKPEEINAESFDVIIHLAAIVHQTSKIDFDQYLKVNTQFPIEVAKVAKSQGVKQFIFLSTSKVYGKYIEKMEPWTEDSVCNPVDAYGQSKHLAEIELFKFNDDAFKVAVLRTPLVYGEGVKANMVNLIKFVDRFPIIPFAGVNSRRSITYVRNLVSFIDQLIMLKACGIFLAKDEQSPTIEELSRAIAKTLGKSRIFVNPGWLTLKMVKILLPSFYERLFSSALVDNTKTLNALGIKPKFNLDDGLQATIEFYSKR